MSKGVHKVFKTIVKKISQEMIPLGEYGSEFSHFIPEPRKFSEVKKNSRLNKETLAKGNYEGD